MKYFLCIGVVLVTFAYYETSFPVKVLFAIDCSLSIGDEIQGQLAGSDPHFLRIEAVRNFIDTYNTNENVSFEIMLWNNDVFRRTRNAEGNPGFTKDPAELNYMLDSAYNDTMTDCLGTLDGIYADVQRDILHIDNEENLIRSKYIVVFLSDGMSNVQGGRQSDSEIWNRVEETYDMATEAGVGSFNFHTFLLLGMFPPGSEGDQARQIAENTLQGMASRGQGQFRLFETAEAIDFINIVDMRLTVEYSIKYMLAYNYNCRPGIEIVCVDSDGDGLIDDDESSAQPYFLTIDYQMPAEGNESFAQAETLVVDDADTCQTDNIGAIGDLDCFRFDTPGRGIYAVKVDFTPFAGGTDVDLGIELYDADGELLDSLTSGQGNFFQLLPRLDDGRHYIVIKDQGQNDFDSASHYEVCVESVAVDEIYTNDTAAVASSMTYDAGTRTFSADGAIAYADDEDWYALPIGSLGSAGLKVLNVHFDDAGDEALVFNYQLDLQDDGDNSLLSHTFVSGSSSYSSQIMSGSGDHLLVVKAAEEQKNTAQAPYTVSVEVLDIDDPPEIQGDGNNTLGTADALSSGAAANGKIAFRGDEDWYRIEVDTSTPKVLEIFLDTSAAGRVEHYLSLMRDGVIKKTHDEDGSDGPTELKTSVWVPQSTTAPHTATYLIKISDYQNDEGDDVAYTLQASVLDIPAVVPNGPAANPTYFDEISERGDLNFVEVELETTSLVQASFNADTGLLDYRNGGAGITQTVNPDGTTTISFPWIAGYIDYQGDQDWFQIAMQTLDPDNPDDQWYYDVEVRLASGAATDVEYVWKYYRDSNDNEFLVDRPTENDGYIGCVGDQDPIDNSVIDIDTQILADDLWVGDGWSGMFYFAVSDFNYVSIPDSYASNPRPDDDWGYNPAYYFKVTLVYHPGLSRPE